MNTQQPTNQELLEAINTSFGDVESRLNHLESHMATKEDLKAFATKEDLGKMELNILDGVDRKLTDLKGDMVVMMRDEDHKVDELIKVLHEKNVLNERESERLLKLRPFPQPVG